MNNPPLTQPSNRATNILLIAAWFGSVTGLLEGMFFLALQKLMRLELKFLEPFWQGKQLFLNSVSLEIVWISALSNLLLFIVLGLVLIGMIRLFPQLPWVVNSIWVFTFLACLDLVALSIAGPIHMYAVLTLALGFTATLVRRVRKEEVAALRFWRKSLLWIITAILLVMVGIQGGLWLQERIAVTKLPAASPGSPNILLIVIDTLRADHLSSYGYGRPTSPKIDRIAREGVLFENALATSSYTLPSHASLLTGLYPYQHGVEWHNSRALVYGRYPTLSEALRSRGYRTAAFSANVFWFTRNRFGRGFIRFEDYFHSISDMFLRTLYGRAIEKFILPRLGFEDSLSRKQAADINRSLVRWIERDREKPFFAFLNYMDTHDPYLPPQPYRSKFSRLKNPGGILNWRVGRSDPQMKPEQLQGEIDAYDGAIAYVDDHIGQLLNELEKRGLAENTLLIITSDHGEAFGEHNAFLHSNSLYREEIHVPLIFRWPRQVPAGVRVARPVTNALLPATVMNLIRGDPTLFPGPPLTGLWRAPNSAAEWPHSLSEISGEPWVTKKAPVHHGSIKSLVNPRWHYIEHQNMGNELYDWKNDPSELQDLAERPDMQATVTRFQSRLKHTMLPEGTATAKLPRAP